MNKVFVTCKGSKYEISSGETTLDFIKKNSIKVKDPVAAIINGHLTRLNKEIIVSSSIDILELASPQGRRIYEGSILYLFLVAFKKFYPEREVFIQHSIQKGLYIEVKDGELTDIEVENISAKMMDLASGDYHIEKISMDWDQSMSELEKEGRTDVINLHRYRAPTIFKFYELEGVRESLYLPLVPSTGILKYFKLHKYRNGVVIVIPEFNGDYIIPEFVDRPKLFGAYQEYQEWSRILKVRTVGQLNKYIMDDSISDLVKVAESLHEKKVARIADMITNHSDTGAARLVLIAGPTSSGKTTFAKRLGIQLRVNGFRPVEISMDNYFVDRAHTPRDEEGNYDFETIEAIDVPLFKEHIAGLIAGEEVEIPRFDFHTGTKKGSGEKMKLERDQILIIEGIHGINPKLTGTIADKDKFKIYIAPLTQLNLHRHDRIPASDTRMIRRMVRDSFFRGYSASDTLNRWKSVRTGEKKNIFPLQEEADVVFNSALFYELSALKPHAERELRKVERTDPVYPEAQRLLKFLSYFLPMDTDVIPNNSLVREFIGGSAFRY